MYLVNHLVLLQNIFYNTQEKKFDIAPFVDSRCKTPITEIQAAVDGAISKEQVVKLRQCLDHIDELNKHISEVEQEILRLSDKYEAAFKLNKDCSRIQ